MSDLITILSVTANTPVDIYYSASTGSTLVVAGQSIFPYSFTVPSPIDETDYVLELVDSQSCVVDYTVLVSPTPTPTQTSTPPVTPTTTPTNTPTPSITPTNTPTNTSTPTNTPTNTPTPTPTPTITSFFTSGYGGFSTSGNSCSASFTSLQYYCYISAASSMPVLGAVVYTINVSGVLYSPYNGGNLWIKSQWSGGNYAIRINGFGEIIDFNICP